MHYAKLILGSLVAALWWGCAENNPLSDAQKTAALRNVTVTYDSAGVALGLPAGAATGRSFEELKAEDSATYCNPANYSITIVQSLTADNTGPNAEDAKFDGMEIDVVFDTIGSAPLTTTAGGFEVKKNTALPVTAEGTMNLATHRPAGLYVFRQIVDGNDLATTMSPALLYKIGSAEGTIDIPAIHADIPTRASQETKDFLAGLLASGVFDEQQ